MTLEEKLARVRAQFRSRIDREGRELLALTERPSLDAAELQQLRFLSHGLAGSAPMFDFRDLGTRALAVEDAIRDADTAGRTLTVDERSALARAAAQFDQAWRDAISG